jgi:flavin-dependent dehydrogenase
LAGLTLARQLVDKHPDIQILILEKRVHPVDEGAYKVGESTIEVGAHYLAEEVGLKKHLVDDQLPKFGLRFFFNQGTESIAHGIEVGLSEFFPAPGYQVDRGRLENHLAASLTGSGAKFVSARIKQVELADDEGPHTVHYVQDHSPQIARSRWVVDASGRAAIVKRQLDLGEQIEHEINAAWFRISASIHVDQWCEDHDWRRRAGKVARRWLSTNHLLGRGYWVWIIPLASGATSIGIVADPRLHPLTKFNRFDKALAWLKQHEPLCAESIDPHRDQLQDFMAIKRIGHGCREVFSARRWAITGEAGVFLDPLYSPGIDYIAMANTMIASLIEHDRQGTAIDLMAARYQGIFLNLFHDNLQTYQDQYPLFGNARVMSLKYVWDYAIYWSFPALFYFNGKLTDPPFFSTVTDGIETLRTLNFKMQKFFRDWDAVDGDPTVQDVFVDQNGIGILKQLNAELRDRLDDHALQIRFKRNVGMLQDLAAEISGRVTRLQPTLRWDAEPAPAANQSRLDGVFSALNL